VWVIFSGIYIQPIAGYLALERQWNGWDNAGRAYGNFGNSLDEISEIGEGEVRVGVGI